MPTSQPTDNPTTSKTAKDFIVDAYEGLQDLLDNGAVAGKDAGKARSVSNFLLKANETDSVYTAIVATSDASEALDCFDNPTSVFSAICLLIASALGLLADQLISQAS